jgi:hypothetical protein
MPAEPPARRPILVSGVHRSGTTWVGKMLAADPGTAYISEPLNVLHRPGVFGAPIVYWYTYICAENEARYLPAFERLLRLRYDAWAELGALRSRKDLLRMGRDLGIFVRGRLRRARPLLKDPFAIFSLPWFIQRLDCQVVITVRHPAAFASSLKRLDWPFDFTDLLAQPLLLRDWLGPHQAALRAMMNGPQDIIAQASLLWSMAYGAVAECQRRFPHIRVARHEDLSRNPGAGFRALYQDLGLDFTPAVEQAVLASSSAENPAELSRQAVHAVRLDSRANLGNWKKRLTADEVERIRRLTEAVSAQFYPEQDWAV